MITIRLVKMQAHFCIRYSTHLQFDLRDARKINNEQNNSFNFSEDVLPWLD